MKTIYFIRHCESSGQQPMAPLTAEGERQARELASFLAGAGIVRIVTSSYARAHASAVPLADLCGRNIERDERFREQTLTDADLPDWREHLKRSFDDPDLRLPGGESGGDAQTRASRAIQDCLEHPACVTAVVTHGRLLTLILQQYDKTFGFDTWQRLTNPDVFRVDYAEDETTIQRIWPD